MLSAVHPLQQQVLALTDVNLLQQVLGLVYTGVMAISTPGMGWAVVPLFTFLFVNK